jgi:hypothetical protein
VKRARTFGGRQRGQSAAALLEAEQEEKNTRESEATAIIAMATQLKYTPTRLAFFKLGAVMDFLEEDKDGADNIELWHRASRTNERARIVDAHISSDVVNVSLFHQATSVCLYTKSVLSI